MNNKREADANLYSKIEENNHVIMKKLTINHR